jgi:hypothetical protein
VRDLRRRREQDRVDVVDVALWSLHLQAPRLKQAMRDAIIQAASRVPALTGLELFHFQNVRGHGLAALFQGHKILF